MNHHLVIEGSVQHCAAALELLRTHGITACVATVPASSREELLPEEQQRYRDLFVSAPVGIFRSSVEGKLLSVNPATARMLKYESPEEMLRLVNERSIAEVLYVDPDHRQRNIAAVLRHGGWEVFQEQFRCKDGSTITCNFHYRAVPWQGDAPREFEGFFEDISERTRAEEALRVSRFIIDHASI
ncbi:PAS domain S-box protein, partial [bacterium]